MASFVLTAWVGNKRGRMSLVRTSYNKHECAGSLSLIESELELIADLSSQYKLKFSRSFLVAIQLLKLHLAAFFMSNRGRPSVYPRVLDPSSTIDHREFIAGASSLTEFPPCQIILTAARQTSICLVAAS